MMFTITRLILITVATSCALKPAALFAQAVPLAESFAQLVQAHAALGTEATRVELVAGWVSKNDWRSLPLGDQAWLHAQLLALDQVDRSAFSVRWTGLITAPRDGAYVFTQHHLPGAYGGTLKLWVDETLVLDTSTATQRLGAGPELALPAEGTFSSQPINLTAGRAVPIKVEFVYHDEFPDTEDHLFRWRFPLPLLLWKSGDGSPKILGPDALTPPSNFVSSDPRGLRADYFNDTEFAALLGSFTEPGVQLIWNQRVILPRYKEAQGLILEAIRSRIVSPFGVPADEAASLVRQVYGQVLPGLTAEDRALALRNLAADEQLLAQLDIKSFASWMPHVAMLPDREPVDLLAAWSEVYEVTPMRIAPHVGYGPGSYAALNYGQYRAAGLWMTGPAWPSAQLLIDEYLERADGSCNLLVSYITSFSSRYNYSPGKILRAIEQHEMDTALPADTRVTWLLAKGFARELFVGGLPKPDLATPFLVEGRLLAEGNDMRFRLFQEMVARYASVGQTESALIMINAEGDEFNAPEDVQVVDRLRTEVTALEDYFGEESSRSQARRAKAAETRLNELRRRLNEAAEKGLEDVADHYRQALAGEETPVN